MECERRDQSAGGGRDFEKHSQTQVDQVSAGRTRGDGARRRDHGHEADRSRDLERQTEREVQERDEKDTAAKTQERAKHTGHDTCTHDRCDEVGRYHEGVEQNTADRILSHVPARPWLGNVAAAAHVFNG